MGIFRSELGAAQSTGLSGTAVATALTVAVATVLGATNIGPLVRDELKERYAAAAGGGQAVQDPGGDGAVVDAGQAQQARAGSQDALTVQGDGTTLTPMDGSGLGGGQVGATGGFDTGTLGVGGDPALGAPTAPAESAPADAAGSRDGGNDQDLARFLAEGSTARALGLAAAGAMPLDQALLTLGPKLSSDVVNSVADALDVPQPLGDGASAAAAVATAGALAGQVDGETVLEAGAGQVADSVVTDALGGVGVPGVPGAAGDFVNGLIQGKDVEQALAEAGVDIAATTILDFFASDAVSSALAQGASPAAAQAAGQQVAGVMGPFLSVWTSALLGGKPPGPGSTLGAVAGAVLGGPLGALGGGLLGGLLDGLLGFGKPSKFDITDADVTGDGAPDNVKAYISDADYGYHIAHNIDQLPVRDAYFQLDEREVRTGESVDDGVPVYEKRYVVNGAFTFEPLFPSTDAPMVRLDYGGGLRESVSPALQAEREAEYEGLSDWYTARNRDERRPVPGYEVTEEEFRALEAALGGREGHIGAADPRMAHLKPFAGKLAGVQFRQQDKDQGIFFRYDINGDGAPDLFRTTPDIDDFVEGDNKTRLVQLGTPPPPPPPG